MGFVWSSEEIERYRSYYADLTTHHHHTYATFATTEAFARHVLPPCLEVADQPAVTVGRMEFTEWVQGVPNFAANDRALMIIINAKYGSEEGSYCLILIEEEEMNVQTGREFAGEPKKLGCVSIFEDGTTFLGEVDRKGHRLADFRATIGSDLGPSPEEAEINFELRGRFGPGPVRRGAGIRPLLDTVWNSELFIFELPTVTEVTKPLTNVSVTLAGSRFDSGIGEIPLGELLEANYTRGVMAYGMRDVVDLSNDGHDYAPYLFGRLYDDWPDARNPKNQQAVAAASVTA